MRRGRRAGRRGRAPEGSRCRLADLSGNNQRIGFRTEGLRDALPAEAGSAATA